MKKTRFALILAVAPALTAALGAPAGAQGFAMGYGANSCAEVLEIIESGDAKKIGEVAGWVLGYWTASTYLIASEKLTEQVKNAGAEKVFGVTMEQCRQAPPDMKLIVVAYGTINALK